MRCVKVSVFEEACPFFYEKIEDIFTLPMKDNELQEVLFEDNIGSNLKGMRLVCHSFNALFAKFLGEAGCFEN